MSYYSSVSSFSNFGSGDFKFSFKIFQEASEGDMKRFTLKTSEIKVSTLHQKARTLFKLADSDIIYGGISFKYKDSEGDWITIKTDEELADAVNEQLNLHKKNFLCLKVCVSNHNSA
jgi:hypothetical protein